MARQGRVTVEPKYREDARVSDAALTQAATISVMPAMADLTAAPAQADFNALLQALRDAGLMATE